MTIQRAGDPQYSSLFLILWPLEAEWGAVFRAKWGHKCWSSFFFRPLAAILSCHGAPIGILEKLKDNLTAPTSYLSDGSHMES